MTNHDDGFDAIREEVRHQQHRLRVAEDEFHTLQRQTVTDQGYMPLHGHYHHIEEIERHIVHLRQRMPPYAKLRPDGIVELLPVIDAINPRETV